MLASRNPRARTGRDGNEGQWDVLHAVSIHAPARGATQDPLQVQKVMLRFNPRARTGRDRAAAAGISELPMVSIHAPARGATAPIAPISAKAACFNPRARTGRDQFRPLEIGLEIVSIHAPARGAT